MTLRWPVFIALLFGFCGLGVAIASHSFRESKDSLQIAREEWTQATIDAQRVCDLRKRDEVIAGEEAPDQDVISLILDTLANNGIPHTSFRNLERESDTTIRGSHGTKTRYQKQSVKLVLDQLSPKQVGLFLQGLRSSQKVWIPSRIELVHSREKQQSQSHYDVVIVLSSIYLSE